MNIFNSVILRNRNLLEGDSALDEEKIFGILERDFENDLEYVRRFLRQPSVSYTGEGILETARMVQDMIESLGGTADLVSVPGGIHPVVYGKVWSGSPHTILVYGMYDVMPADEQGWIAPPFGAEIHEVEGIGPCVINRGAANTKGPLAGFFTSMRAVQRCCGSLPLNLIFVIEGEEEYGSRSLPSLFSSHLSELKEAEAAIFPFFGCDKKGIPAIRLGTKGLLYFELTCQGGDWGGPVGRAIHGSNNVWIASPVWKLIQALSTMEDEEENITIDDFFEDVIGPTEEDKELCETLARSSDLSSELEALNAVKFKKDLDAKDLYLYAHTQPQLNIDGISAGYTGSGTKTVLPSEATAKMDIRLVPNMDPDKTASAIRNHLDDHGFKEVEMKVINKYPWSKVSLHEHIVQALINACAQLGAPPRVYPLNIGSAPFYLFDRVLGIPYAFGGMGHGDRQHSSNEYFSIPGFLEFEKSMVLLIKNYGEGLE